mmetsp:Transcript_158/g.566  ORF Transcript_158/g.566 Transcript_158/m.566 type:complete len:116 (-) Transcript_158:1257-1604(-)
MTDRPKQRTSSTSRQAPKSHEPLVDHVNPNTDLRIIDSLETLIRHAGDANPGRTKYRQMKTRFTTVGELLNHSEHELVGHYKVPKGLTQHMKSIGFKFPNPDHTHDDPSADVIGM